MKMHIDTIPVWDAMKADCECPLCRIRLLNEHSYVDSFLGASVMESNTRVEVNEKGFCLHHDRMMFEAGNRLGLALMTHTHMKATMSALGGMSPAKKAAKRRPLTKTREGQAGDIEALTKTCILCDRLNNTMDRYAYTLIYMWESESEFRRALESSKGFCIPHYGELVRIAPDHLSGGKLDEFLTALEKVEMEGLKRVESELEWFTLKFDYRNHDKPWGSSQDAVERAILKLRGQMSIEKPEDKKKY